MIDPIPASLKVLTHFIVTTNPWGRRCPGPHLMAKETDALERKDLDWASHCIFGNSCDVFNPEVRVPCSLPNCLGASQTLGVIAIRGMCCCPWLYLCLPLHCHFFKLRACLINKTGNCKHITCLIKARWMMRRENITEEPGRTSYLLECETRCWRHVSILRSLTIRMSDIYSPRVWLCLLGDFQLKVWRFYPSSKRRIYRPI